MDFRDALPGYRVPPQADAAESISVETGGQRLLRGRTVGGNRVYDPLPLEPARLKER